MKKLFIVLLVGFFSIGLTFADSTSLALNGDVTEYISVGLSSGSIDLIFDGTGAAVDALDTTLNVKSNKKAWTITFTSLYGGVLKNAALNNNIGIPYLVQVVPAYTSWGGTISDNPLASAAVQLTAPAVITAGTDSRTPKAGINFTVSVSAAAQEGTATLYEAGESYTDTVTITIALP
jgi:hypothetical protein